MSERSKLFSHRRLYDVGGTDASFVAAMREMVGFHTAACPEYAQILQHQDYDPNSLQTIDDLHRLPPLPTLFLKSHTLLSTPWDKLLFKATSSGTGGRPSQAGLDRDSSWQAFKMVWRTFRHHGVLSPRRTNYIVLGYEPSDHNQMGAVQTAYGTTLAAPAHHREYALKDTGSTYELNIGGIVDALRRYEKEGKPVRFMGFPAYFYFLLQILRDEGIQLQLHPKSMVMLAGGWKQFFFQAADKQELYALSRERLGIDDSRFRDFYGAVEHPIVYCDCKNHHFHQPVYSRVIVRDPVTLEPVPMGTPGILNLITPLMKSMPFLSVMTDDLGIMHPPEECGCGINAPWFEILGRAGLDIKTCAAGAAELLKGVGQ